MRELQLYPAKKRLTDVVRKLQFVADGSEFIAWIDEDDQQVGGSYFITERLFACNVASGDSQRMECGELWDIFDGPVSVPACSPDGRYLVAEPSVEYEDDNFLLVEDRSTQDTLPYVPTKTLGFGSLFFTSDSSALIAVRNGVEGEDNACDVAKFEMAQLTQPPKRFKKILNRFTGQWMEAPVRNLKWKTLIAHPEWKRAVSASLSSDGRFLAVGDVTGNVHVVDLKKKRAVVVLPPVMKSKRDRVAIRIDFDPAAKWIIQLAGGKLFSHPLGDGKAWQTKPSLGIIQDFAIHPSGRILGAVFADGQARCLDLVTGTVLQVFRWSKKPLYSVAFSPDGLTCAAGGQNGKVILWDVDI